MGEGRVGCRHLQHVSTDGVPQAPALRAQGVCVACVSVVWVFVVVCV